MAEGPPPAPLSMHSTKEWRHQTQATWHFNITNFPAVFQDHRSYKAAASCPLRWMWLTMRTLTYCPWKFWHPFFRIREYPVAWTGVIRLATPTLSGCFQFSGSFGGRVSDLALPIKTPHAREARIQLPGETRAKLPASVWLKLIQVTEDMDTDHAQAYRGIIFAA
jgi:hypothetical protein